MNDALFAYYPGRSFLHEVDPIKKMLWLVLVGIMSMAYQNAMLQLPLFALLFVTATFFTHIPPLKIFVNLKPIWYLAVFVLVIQSLAIKGEILILSLGIAKVYYEGILAAAAVAFRMVNIAMASIIFLYSTHPRDLAIAASEKLKFPIRGAQALFLALRFLPLLQDEYQDLVAAHKVRGAGGGKGIKDKLTRIQRFTVPYLFSGLRRAQITALAMDSKAFGAYPTKTYYHQLAYPARGIAFLLVWVMIAAIFTYLVLSGTISDLGQVRFA